MTVDAGALASAPPVNAPPVAWSVAGTCAGTCAPCVSFSTQPDSGRAPLLPGLAEASQAPLQTKSRRRARILVGAAASLLAHAALAALVWRTPTPAPQPGLVELTIVYAGDTLQQPAGQTSLELETEPPAALAQELEVQELEVKKTPAPQQESAVLQPPATALVQKAEPAAGPAAEPAVMASVSQMQTEDKPILDKPTPSAPALKKPSPPPRAAAQQLGEKSRAEKSRTEGRAAAESRGAQTSALAPPHYLTAVFARVQQAKRYPAKAQARGDQGRAVVSISIRRNGALAEARLVRSSGSSLLDEATLEVMRRAAPFPPLPPDVAGSVLVLSIPMNFTIE